MLKIIVPDSRLIIRSSKNRVPKRLFWAT